MIHPEIKDIKKNKKKIASILAVAMFFIFFSTARAETFYSFWPSISGGDVFAFVTSTSTTPQSEYAAWSFSLSSNKTLSQVVMPLSSGYYSTTDQAYLELMTNSAGIPGTVLSTSLLIDHLTSTIATTTFYFNEYPLVASTTYWLRGRRTIPVEFSPTAPGWELYVQTGNGNSVTKFKMSNNGWIPDGAQYDVIFSLNNDGIPLEVIPDDSLRISQVDCCTDLSCQIPISFTSYLDSKLMRVAIDSPSGCNIFMTGDDYTLNYYAGTPTYITLAPQSAGIHNLCALVDNYATLVPINYYSSSSNPYCIAQALPEQPIICDDSICEYASSSVFLTWQDFTCGLKQAGCWLINPSTSSLSFIVSSKNILETKFPFSAYFYLANSVKSGLTTTTDDRTGGIGLPMYSRASSSFYWIPVLTASSIPNAIGENNSNLFRSSIVYIFYAMLTIYIIVRITL